MMNNEVKTINGYNIKDEKAIRSYTTVALMKSDTKLAEGQHVKTKGFYNSLDGGHGEYIIVDDNSLVADNKFIHSLNNGLFAVLVVNNDEVNIRTIGATTNYDIHDYVLAIVDEGYTCYIPSGIWKTTPLQIARYNTVRIKGENIYGINNSNGTILTPVDNQIYIMKVGYDNTTSIANDINIENIQFSTAGYTCVNALLFSRVQFSNFKELGFRNCKCSDCTFRIRETWETRFGRMLFRQNDSSYALIFGEKVGTGNISSNYFEYMSFEGCRGTCIKFEENTGYSMNTIDTLDFESGTVAFNDEERVSINTPDSYTHLAVIETGNGYGEISINNLNLNSINQYAYVNTETHQARGYDRVIEANNTDIGYYNFAIGTISGTGNVNTPILINANTIDKISVNSNIFRAGTYFVSYINGCREFNYLNNEFANKFTKSNYDRAYRDLKIDGTKASCVGKSDHAVRVATLITKGEKLYVHAKGNGNINYGGSDHVTLSNVENYTWYEIDITGNITDETNLLLGTNSTVELDDYFMI